MAPNPMKPTCLLIIHLLELTLCVITQTQRDQVSADINGMLMHAPNLRKDLRFKTHQTKKHEPSWLG
jgi:hypothetical protein